MKDNLEPLSISTSSTEPKRASTLGCSRGILYLPPKLLILLIIITKAMIYADKSVMSATMPLLTKQGFEITKVQAGMIGSILNLGVVISTAVSAHFAKSHHPFTMVTAGQLVWTLTVFCSAISSDFWMLFLARALTGLSEGVYLTVISPCVLELAPGLSKTLWYSIYMSSIPVGSALGYLFGANVGADFGWRTPFFISALIMLPLAMCFSLVHRDPKLSTTTNVQSEESLLQEVRKLCSSRIYVCMVFGLAFLFFSGGGIGYWLPYVLNHQYGIDDKIAGDIASLMAFLGGIIGSIVGSLIQDKKLAPYQRQFEAGEINEARLNAIRCFTSLKVCCYTLTTAFFLNIIGASSGNFYLFILCMVTGNIISNFNIGSFGMALMTCVDKSMRNHAIGYSVFIGQLFGGFPGPFILGAFIDGMGLYWAVILQTLFMIPGCLLWLAALQSSNKVFSSLLNS
mmetsp:Transcript_27247/g.48955  ORF Transcript_27247/g.48955 Transcript_27247/m.48955 type:complete len:456 (-) Transcript_27247:1286-2653(-)